MWLYPQCICTSIVWNIHECVMTRKASCIAFSFFLMSSKCVWAVQWQHTHKHIWHFWPFPLIECGRRTLPCTIPGFGILSSFSTFLLAKWTITPSMVLIITQLQPLPYCMQDCIPLAISLSHMYVILSCCLNSGLFHLAHPWLVYAECRYMNGIPDVVKMLNMCDIRTVQPWDDSDSTFICGAIHCIQHTVCV